MEDSSTPEPEGPFNLYSYLDRNALAKPNELALVTPEVRMTWAELKFLADRVAAKLRFTGVRPGEKVLVAVGSAHGWLLQLGLFHEAAVAVAGNGGGVNAQIQVDWLIASKPVPAMSIDRTILVDQAWFDDAASRFKAQEAHRYDSEQSLVRVGFTSGTTGIPKAVPFDLEILDNRSNRIKYGQDYPEPYLCLLGSNSASGYMAAVRSVVWGQTLYLFPVSDDGVWDFISENKIACITASPVQMRGILPKFDISRHNIESLELIITAGSVLPSKLAAEIRQILGVGLRNVYGSTEAGRVARIDVTEDSDPQVAGNLTPEIRVRIVDESVNDLPAGEVGRVLVRTPSVVKGYLNNPEATKAQFHEGWFFPGDEGFIDQQGRLVLQGRSSEIFNAGGVKVNPEKIDEYLTAFPGVNDAASFMVTDRLGMVWTVGGVVPASSGFDMKALSIEVKKKLGPRGPKVVMPIKKVPRNENGKIMRTKLAEDHREVILKLLEKMKR